MITLLALSLAAQAADPAFVVGSGLEVTINDPFAVTWGAHLSADVELWPWLRLGVSGGGYPMGGEQAWTSLTSQLIDYHVTPDISSIRLRGAGQVTVLPLRQTTGDRARLFGGYLGLGGVYTIDDLDALQAQDDPEALASERQLHPIVHIGLLSEVWRGSWGGRLRMEYSSYTEILYTTIQESRRPAWIGLDLVRRWP